MHLVLTGEFLRRLNIWLDHQSDNGFLSQSKDEVDAALLNVKFPWSWFQPQVKTHKWTKKMEKQRACQYWRLSSWWLLLSFCPPCHHYLVVDRWHYYWQRHRNCQTSYMKLSAANTMPVWRKRVSIHMPRTWASSESGTWTWPADTAFQLRV